jgi:hypothetical protein
MLVYNDYWDKLSSQAKLIDHNEWNINEGAKEYNELLFQNAYEVFSQRFEGIEKDEKEKKEYIRQCYDSQYKRITDTISKDIINKVADIRLLVLGTITNEIYQCLLDNARQADAELIAMEHAFQVNIAFVKNHIPVEDYENAYVGYHDAFVIDSGYEDNNLYLKLKIDHGFDDFYNLYTKVIYENAELIEGNWNTDLNYWIYSEIYYKDGKIELHIRFSGGDIILRTERIRRETYHSIIASDEPLIEENSNKIFVGTMEEDSNAEHSITEDAQYSTHNESLEKDFFSNMRLLLSKYYGSFGLEVHESNNKEFFQKLADKKYIYELKFENRWLICETSGTTQWLHGEEIRDYIVNKCKRELEIWSVWMDSLEKIELKELEVSSLKVEDIEEIYKETKNGIAKSTRLLIKNS